MAASQTIRTLKLSLLADLNGFGPNLKTAQSDFDKFQQGISRAAVPAAAALTAIGTAAFSAITAASDLSQTFGAVEQVFGGRAARRIEEFSLAAADALGQSRQDALGAAQQFGILGRAAELEGDELADFAITLATLASDLAAFGNTNPQDAINALGSALRGEFNPIERYGVVLNAAATQQIALREGLAETATEITAADQVYARFLAIVEQTQIQQGQFARESESLASQSAIAKANLENFRIEVGEQLVPVLGDVLPLVADFVAFIGSLDPETIVLVAQALAGIAASITLINVALKAFAALQGAAKLLGALFASGVGAPLVAGGAILGGIGYAASQGLEGRDTTPQPFAPAFGYGEYAGPGFRPGDAGFVPNRFSRAPGGVTINNVNVSGFVGNERELARAIQRAQEQARRSGALRPAGSFG